MKNKLFISALALTVLTPVLVQPIQADAAVKNPFKDVSKDSPYYKIIHEMLDQNIISGYEDGTFKPNEVISRKHAAALVNRAKKLPVAKNYVKFKDVSEGNAYFKDIKKLQQAGIFEPDSKGNFNPNQPITRAEMAKVLTLAFDLKVKVAYDFPDVPSNHAASGYVRAIYSNGITTGDKGLFNPNKSLTRAHYAVFMQRAMNLDKNHVAKPIEKPVTPVTPSPEPVKPYDNGNNTGTLADNYERPSDMPKPQGYISTEEQQKKLNEIRVKEIHNRVGSFTLFSKNGKNYIESESVKYGITASELTTIINQSIETGQVYDGGNFALYYNFNTGQIEMSYKR